MPSLKDICDILTDKYLPQNNRDANVRMNGLENPYIPLNFYENNTTNLVPEEMLKRYPMMYNIYLFIRMPVTKIEEILNGINEELHVDEMMLHMGNELIPEIERTMGFSMGELSVEKMGMLFFLCSFLILKSNMVALSTYSFPFMCVGLSLMFGKELKRDMMGLTAILNINMRKHMIDTMREIMRRFLTIQYISHDEMEYLDEQLDRMTTALSDAATMREGEDDAEFDDGVEDWLF